jgi:hypothetical protein
MITKGQIMGRNRKSIWITKNSKKIFFDILIPTTKGMLFAMYFTQDTKMTNVAKNKVGTKSLEAREGRKDVNFETEGVDFKC